jgi:hypothetical protein
MLPDSVTAVFAMAVDVTYDVFVTTIVEVLLHSIAVVFSSMVALMVELVAAGGATTPVVGLNTSSGETHDVTRGRTVEKMFVEVPIA